MLTWRVSYGKGRNIGNVSFSLIHMVGIVFLVCIQVKEKVVEKADSVAFANFNALFK